jgi:hypothetical protein
MAPIACTLVALDDTILDQNSTRIVEHASRSFEIQTVVLPLVDSTLRCIPFEAHRHTQCITGGPRKSTPSPAAKTGSRVQVPGARAASLLGLTVPHCVTCS